MIIKRKIERKEDELKVKNVRQFEDDGWWTAGEFYSYDFYLETFADKIRYFKDIDIMIIDFENKGAIKAFFKRLFNCFELEDVHTFIAYMDDIYDTEDAAYFLHKTLMYNTSKMKIYISIFDEFERFFTYIKNN